MSVRFLKEAASAGQNDKLVRFVRLHTGDGNEQVGAREIDKSWTEAIKNLLRYDPVDEGALPALSRPTSPRWHCSISTCRDTATPGTLYTINERYPGSMIEKSDFVPLAHPRKLSVRTAPDVDQFMRRA